MHRYRQDQELDGYPLGPQQAGLPPQGLSLPSLQKQQPGEPEETDRLHLRRDRPAPS